jgi:hypothetical protein
LSEFNAAPLGRISGCVTQIIGRMNQIDEGDPLQSYRSSSYGFPEHQTGLSRGVNPRVPAYLVARDVNRTRIPIIAIEVACIESWSTIMRSVKASFTLGVLQVIYFKLYKTTDLQLPSHVRVTQLYMMDFRRPDKYVPDMTIQAAKVVCYGHQLPLSATERAILTHTRVHSANFVGYGRHKNNQRCDAAGSEMYQLVFPAEII